MSQTPGATPPPDKTGCAGGFLFLGILLILLSTFGYVIGLSGKKVSLENVELGVVTLKTYILLLVIAALFLGMAAFGWLRRKKGNRR